MTLGFNAFALNKAAIDVKWGYLGNIGPSYWSQISPDFLLCSKGKMQSPINIPRKVLPSTATMTFHYQAAPMRIIDDGTTDLMIGNEQTIINSGHSVQLNFPQEGVGEFVIFKGEQYRLVQLHIHTPSENQLRGRSFPLEIHFVHQGAGGHLLVIGVLAESGNANATLQQIVQHLPSVEGQEQVVAHADINPLSLIPEQRDYYDFMGSLTTPPCSEGVQWILMAKPILVSSSQIFLLKKAMNGVNARNVQPLSRRKIGYAKGS